MGGKWRRRNLGALDDLSSPPVLSRVSTGPPVVVLVHQHNFRELDPSFFSEHSSLLWDIAGVV